MADLVYIVAEITAGLPEIGKSIDGKVYQTYQEAEAIREQFPADIRDCYAVFTVHCITQQEVTFEVPF